jgi:nitrogen regulatory protein PII
MWQEAALSAIILRPTLEAELTKHMAKMDAKAVTAEAVQGAGNSTTRVGRWMSEAEYNEMVRTGQVQMSGDNKVHVANPANMDSFSSQAPKGSIYVEFDVPSNAVFSGGRQDWGIVAGPGSLNDRLNISKGLPGITEMPKATNIEIMGGK